MNTAATLLVGAAIFGGGFVTGQVTAGVASMPAESTAPRDGTDEVQSGRADPGAEILRRLQAIDERLNVATATSPTRAPVEEGRGTDAATVVLKELRDQVAAMLEDVHLQTADLEEVAHLKPSPDLETLHRLWQDVGGDSAKVILRLKGMNYHDASRAFGTPSVKRSKGTPSDKVVEWWWDMPDDGKAFVLEFHEGVANWGGFTSRQGLKGE